MRRCPGGIETLPSDCEESSFLSFFAPETVRRLRTDQADKRRGQYARSSRPPVTLGLPSNRGYGEQPTLAGLTQRSGHQHAAELDPSTADDTIAHLRRTALTGELERV